MRTGKNRHKTEAHGERLCVRAKSFERETEAKPEDRKNKQQKTGLRSRNILLLLSL